MKITAFSYRYAEAVMDAPELQHLKRDIVDVFSAATVPLLPVAKVKVRRRKARKVDAGPRFFCLPVDQTALNLQLDVAMAKRGWEVHPRIVEAGKKGGPQTALKADYRKAKVQVEVQFGNMARWYSDVFKFQLSYSQDVVDAAVLVVPKQWFANLIDENVAYYERVLRELPWAKMSLTLPIWVLGIEPEDDTDIRARYDEAVDLAVQASAAEGKVRVPIGFAQRVAEEAEEDVEDAGDANPPSVAEDPE